MPRQSGVPSYSLHKASSQVVVRAGSGDRYLGVYSTDESHAAYARFIAEWRVQKQSPKAKVHPPLLPRISQLLRFC